MNRGYIKLYRKSLDAGWLKNHKLWAFWSYCLLKATHKEFDAIVGLQVIHLLPGQFVFGRKRASEETGLTEREIRTILAFLRKSGNLTIKTTNKYSVITIVNWSTYQNSETANDQQNDQQVANKCPHTRTKEHKKKTPAGISSQISELERRYPDKAAIDQALNAIASTRKSKRIADTVKLSILKSWASYPVALVMTGIDTYLKKEYAEQGKGEQYLLGIIRNSNGTGNSDMKEAGFFKSTGSPVLDKYYRKQGTTNI